LFPIKVTLQKGMASYDCANVQPHVRWAVQQLSLPSIFTSGRFLRSLSLAQCTREWQNHPLGRDQESFVPSSNEASHSIMSRSRCMSEKIICVNIGPYREMKNQAKFRMSTTYAHLPEKMEKATVISLLWVKDCKILHLKEALKTRTIPSIQQYVPFVLS
jgi:hypothetical protein